MKAVDYSALQKVLHALSALLILWLMVSGFSVGLISEAARYKQVIGNFNVSLSLLLMPLFILRFYVSFGRGFPAAVDVNNIESWLAFIIHTMMYLTVVTVLVSGVLMMDRPIGFFNVVSVPQPFDSSEVHEIFALIHTQACAILVLLVSVHVAAVIKHHRSGRPIIKRMFS